MIKNIVFIQIDGCNISVLVDLGVFVLIINRDFLGKIFYVNDELLLLEFNLVKGVSGRLLLVIGKLNVEIFINGQSYLFMVYVVDGLYYVFILGVDFLFVYDIVFRFLKENIMFILDVQGEVNVCVILIENGYVRVKCVIIIFQRCEMNVLVYILKYNNGDVVLLEFYRDLEVL